MFIASLSLTPLPFPCYSHIPSPHSSVLLCLLNLFLCCSCSQYTWGPSVRFHSCVFLCAFLTSLPLDSVLKISHVTLSLCCPKAERGFSPASLSSLFLKVLSIIQKVMLEGRRDLGSWGHEKDHLCRFVFANSKAGKDKRCRWTGGQDVHGKM